MRTNRLDSVTLFQSAMRIGQDHVRGDGEYTGFGLRGRSLAHAAHVLAWARELRFSDQF